MGASRVVLINIFVLQAVLASGVQHPGRPLAVIDDRRKSPSDYFKGVDSFIFEKPGKGKYGTTKVNGDVDKLREASDAIKQFVAETITDVAKLVEKVASGAYRTLNAFAADTLDMLAAARDKIGDTINTIATDIFDIDDETVKRLFTNIKDILQSIQEIFVDLAAQTEKEFQNIINHVNITLQYVSEDMDEWSGSVKRKLRSVKDDNVYEQGCELVDDFVSSSITELYECCNIAIKPMKTICKSAKNVVGDTLSIAVDIVETVETCLLEKKAQIPVMIACLDDAYDKVVELMSSIASLREALFQTLPTKIVLSNFCISFATVSVEVRKVNIAREIDRKYLRKN